MRTNEEQRFGELLKGVYKQMKITDSVTQHRVKTAWEKRFGATFANYVTRFTFQDNTIVIGISSDALRHELFLNRSKMVKQINEEIGYQMVDKIILK